MYLLDTNIHSAFRQPKKHPAIDFWAQTVAYDALAISIVTDFEIAFGVENLRRRDAIAAASIDRWFRSVIRPGFSDRCLPLSAYVVDVMAVLLAQRTIEFRDLAIGATALAHSLTLVTRNTRHFKHMALDGRVISLFEPTAQDAEVNS